MDLSPYFKVNGSDLLIRQSCNTEISITQIGPDYQDSPVLLLFYCALINLLLF